MEKDEAKEDESGAAPALGAETPGRVTASIGSSPGEDLETDPGNRMDRRGSRPARQRQGSMLRRDDDRHNRMEHLHLQRIIETKIMHKRISMQHVSLSLQPSVTDVEDVADASLVMEVQQEAEKSPAAVKSSDVILRLEKLLGDIRPPGHPLEVRMKDFSYSVLVREPQGDGISTVFNRSPIYYAIRFIRNLWNGVPVRTLTKERPVLRNINLLFHPGKSYLVLGHPGCGKTTLLRAVAGRMQRQAGDRLQGSVLYNGAALGDTDFFLDNMTAFIDQLDKHAPRLTVEETFEFANLCKRSTDVITASLQEHADTNAMAQMELAKKFNVLVKIILVGLGLEGAKDTFVGDADIRGVSGGQRRRVTVGEMMGSLASILCGDEISTGLDAASTYDMIQVLAYFSTFRKFTRVLSLLQASPETVSLFDEIILLSKGYVIYAGPVKEVEDYFAGIGFVCPRFVDVADFLQMVSSEDTSIEFDVSAGGLQERPSIPALADIFRESRLGQQLQADLQAGSRYNWEVGNKGIPKQAQRKYANNFFISSWLLLRRFLVLWKRDKRVIIAGTIKNVIMGLSVGGTYLSTTNQLSILGALFQAVLFIVLGAMQSSSALIIDRTIYYKHADANFYSAWPFVFGRSLSQIPQIFMDTVLFATILYFMIGLGGRESASNFFIYLALLFVFAVLMIQQLAVFASFASSGTLSAYCACVVLLLVLFGGFIIPPATIPGYFKWLYWWNPFAWVYRALVVNEFRSERWTNPDQILANAGFIGPDGFPFSEKWIAWAFVYMVPYCLLCCSLTALGLTFLRNEGGASPAEPELAQLEEDEVTQQLSVEIPFHSVTLSFKNISYDVEASTSNQMLTLLDNISGIFRPGRMCCLMGTSGAGKTTLMDVIALRKRSGIIKGRVCLNGWPQDPISFRRCSGYVEQFDVQTPELTVRESILFSARLRLDPDTIKDDKEIQNFVEHILEAVEMKSLAGVLVGTDETLGLSFEQKKRLSIAVELAASPSILFLDEPTSGLDSRSAMIIVRALRRIADGGRTICATIHQPSASVFEMFDDLLLLKKGGRVVYNGPLGNNNCATLVSYLESKGAPRIELGDNPADWMLRVLESGTVGDLAEEFASSSQHEQLESEIDALHNNPDPEQKIEYEHEYPTTGSQRRLLISGRLNLIYWRSPTYNLSRLLISLVIAFILGSSFVTTRQLGVFTEPEIRARLSVIFLSFIITGIMAIMSVLPVMSKIRDMFYRHHDAGMYDSGALGLALGVAEKFYIVGSCFLFCLCFLGVAGFLNSKESTAVNIGRSIGFFGFYTFNFAIYSYFGQLFVCLVKPQATAIILSSVFIGLNNFFSGLVVLPQFLRGTFYAFPYYITPGHYVYNGMVTSLFAESQETVVASSGSGFEEYLVDQGICEVAAAAPCNGTVSEYVVYFYGGYYGQSGHVANAVALGVFLVAARVLTWVALRYIRFA